MAKRQTFTVTVKRTSIKGPEDLMLEMITASQHISEGLNDMAHLVRDKMRQTINSNKRRPDSSPKGWLEKHIEVNTLGLMSYGIGNKTILNVSAPYWRVLNDGGYIPLSTTEKGVLGFFGDGAPPKKGGDGQAWTYTTGGYGPGIYYMKPSKAIKGIRYIEKTQHWLAFNWKLFWDNRLNRLKWAK